MKKVLKVTTLISFLLAIGLSLSFIKKLNNDYKEKISVVNSEISYINPVKENIPEKYEQIKKEEKPVIVNETKKITEEKKKFIYPSSGDIIAGYSENEIIYLNETGDYRTHSGIDIKTNGEAVVASTDGVIHDCYEDLNNNYIVIIKNEDVEIVYKNIIISPDVKRGMNVKQGDSLGKGTVNDAGEEFIHFEVKENGINKDPLKYFE